MSKSPASEAGYQAVLRTQAAVNERTAGNADRYAEHRRRLMAAIVEVTPAGRTARLCLLGAGNCNDVDLPILARHFQQIQLVDLDAAALRRAAEAQPSDVQAVLTLRAPADVCGLLRPADGWRKTPPTLAQIEAAVPPAVTAIQTAVPGTFEVVASCCVLTQVGHGLTSILGPLHPALGEVHRAAAAAHLRAMAALLTPGGQAVFITDMVSSETYPLEELTPGRDLKDVVAELVRTGNFFKGVNPLALSRILRRDSVLSRQAGPARALEPWLWRAVSARTFLINGFVFARQ